MTPPGIVRRASAEAVGTAFLTTAVVGSGIAAARLSPGDVGLQLLESSLVTGAALTALILTFQTVSAAFNPLVVAADVLLGRATGRDGAVLVTAEVVGAVGGAVLANLMFGLDAVDISGRDRGGTGVWLAEVVATVGLLLVIVGGVRSGGGRSLGYAVGGYIAAAYWFTSSTSFANPALTLVRTMSDTFAGIAPGSVPMFLLAQATGLAVALGLVGLIWPRSAASETRGGEAAADSDGSRCPEYSK